MLRLATVLPLIALPIELAESNAAASVLTPLRLCSSFRESESRSRSRTSSPEFWTIGIGRLRSCLPRPILLSHSDPSSELLRVRTAMERPTNGVGINLSSPIRKHFDLRATRAAW